MRRDDKTKPPAKSISFGSTLDEGRKGKATSKKRVDAGEKYALTREASRVPLTSPLRRFAALPLSILLSPSFLL